MVKHQRGRETLRAVPLLDALARHEVRYVAVGSYPAIAQGIDLPMTDLDIVPATDKANRRRIVAALVELQARERLGDSTETIDELRTDPDSLNDAQFRTFETEYGDLDIVLRPAGFPRGYVDLIGRVVLATVQDADDPSLTVEAFLASLEDIYESKRQARRPKDIAALEAFGRLHSQSKESVRARYRDNLLLQKSDSDAPRSP